MKKDIIISHIVRILKFMIGIYNESRCESLSIRRLNNKHFIYTIKDVLKTCTRIKYFGNLFFLK